MNIDRGRGEAREGVERDRLFPIMEICTQFINKHTPHRIECNGQDSQSKIPINFLYMGIHFKESF